MPSLTAVGLESNERPSDHIITETGVEELVDDLIEKQPIPLAVNNLTTTIEQTKTSEEKKKNNPKAGILGFKKRQKQEKAPTIGMLTLFRFANFRDRILIIIASLCSISIGAIQPLSIVILGNFLRDFTAVLSDGGDIMSVIPVILVFVYLGTANLVLGYTCQCFWVLSGEFQTRRIRKLYVHAILRQDMGWFDQAEEGSLTTRLASDTTLSQDGISEKFGMLLQCFSQFICGFVIAFVKVGILCSEVA